MITFLLIIIYIAFIGLGIPDSLFGTAWPAIYAEFHIPISFASFVTIIISCGTVASSMASARIIQFFGTNKVSAFSTAMTMAALFGFSYSKNLMAMCLFAIPLGLGAGAIDTALNNYVALHYSATHMSFLHCFYGIGVSVSPYILSLVISGPGGWRGGYRIASGIQLCIALILFFTLPVWKKAHGYEHGDSEQKAKVLTLREIARLPGVRLMWCLFLTSCAIEYTCGGWGSTFLVEHRHVLPEHAAKIIMFYYIGMAAGRFLSGILASRLHSWQIIRLGQCVLGVALALFLLPVPSYVTAVGFFMAGFGNGPLFPNFNYLTPENFGQEASSSVMGTQMAASYVGIMLAPALCGFICQYFGMKVFPVYLIVFYLIMVFAAHSAKHILHK